MTDALKTEFLKRHAELTARISKEGTDNLSDDDWGILAVGARAMFDCADRELKRRAMQGGNGQEDDYHKFCRLISRAHISGFERFSANELLYLGETCLKLQGDAMLAYHRIQRRKELN